MDKRLQFFLLTWIIHESDAGILVAPQGEHSAIRL